MCKEVFTNVIVITVVAGVFVVLDIKYIIETGFTPKEVYFGRAFLCGQAARRTELLWVWKALIRCLKNLMEDDPKSKSLYF